MKDEIHYGGRPSLWRRVAVLVSHVYNVRPIVRRSVGAVYAVEHAKTVLSQLQVVTEDLRRELSAIQEIQREGMAQLAREREQLAARLDTDIAQLTIRAHALEAVSPAAEIKVLTECQLALGNRQDTLAAAQRTLSEDLLILLHEISFRQRWITPSSREVLALREAALKTEESSATRVLLNYAWEEGGYPAARVREFNTTLDLITVTSSYVAKVLRDNGVHVPIHIVGAAVSPVFSHKQIGTGVVSTSGLQGDPPFRFLHVSSCFPRKGMDVLLTAWAAAFTQDSSVELVIKTFPSVHNKVGAQVRAFQLRHPEIASIILINQAIEPAAMAALYRSAEVVVCPTRGEGFGFPLAEALAMGKPVITTAYGGQSDFCNPDTAWLCDYTFTYARTYFDVADSVWMEPDAKSLAQLLLEVFATDPAKRARRAEAGRTLVQSRFTYDQVKQLTEAAITSARLASSDRLRSPMIGVISTWNSRCGIAAYAQSLFYGIDQQRLRVFATRVTEVVRADEGFVRRCWFEGWDDSLDELFQEVRGSHVDAVVLQLNFGFFRPDALLRLLNRLHADGILVFITLHSTTDVSLPGMTVRLADFRPALARVCRLLVHSIHDLNRLKDIGLVENVTLFPMGAPAPFTGDRQAVRRSLGLDGKTIIASFGYLLPNKGIPELIRAFSMLLTKFPDIHLLLLNALYPIDLSQQEREVCVAEICCLGMQDHVTLVTDFLAEDDVLARLSSAHVVVFPYQRTQESSSAAVKMGLSSGTPVAATPLPIFADIAGLIYTLSGTAASDIADGLSRLLSDPALLTTLATNQRSWAITHDWVTLASRLDGLIRGEMYAHVVAQELRVGAALRQTSSSDPDNNTLPLGGIATHADIR